LTNSYLVTVTAPSASPGTVLVVDDDEAVRVLLTRYLELMNRDPHLTPVQGVFAAQEIKPQARVLAEDRGIRCVVLDYDAMRGVEGGHARLF